jgi:hypothetical protein
LIGVGLREFVWPDPQMFLQLDSHIVNYRHQSRTNKQRARNQATRPSGFDRPLLVD